MSERTATFRPVRILLLPVILVLLATFAPSRLAAPITAARTASIAFAPVPFDADAPQRSRIGSLVFRQGWALTSANPRFGGLSAMRVEGNGIIAISDAGSLIRFPLPGHGSVVTGHIEPLPDGPGSPDIKSQRDSEAMLLFGGKAWVGFERQNAVWRYSAADWRSDTHAKPPAMRRWPRNAGCEAMVRLSDGRFLLFSEEALRKDGTSEVLLFDGDPAVPGTKAVTLGYRAPTGYDATDAAFLPDGRLLILNRRFTVLEGVSVKLVLAVLPPLRAGSIIAGTEIADMRPPVTVDNMEALSVTAEGGRTIVWMASDDNFSPLQRTLLMKFELRV